MLQGGEDAYYTDHEVCAIVSSIKEKYPDCAVTLSIGEKKKASYLAFFYAGADRYLLRHEQQTKSIMKDCIQMICLLKTERDVCMI